MKNLIKICMALVLSAGLFSSCSDDDVETPQTVVDVASSRADMTILVDALQRTGLVGTLAAQSQLTVFAPNNAAFQALLDGNDDWDSLDDIPATTLSNILKFHVLGARVTAGQLSDTYVSTLATGPNDEPLSLQVETTGGVAFNGSAEPLETDIDGGNGVIHIIDRVMMLPTVVNKALENPDFSILVQALTDSRLTTDLVGLLSSDGPFTVFAPTNAAFQRLLDSNDDWNSLADIPAGTLEAVLTYHVISNANVQSDQLTNDQTVTTANGAEITIDLTDTPKVESESNQAIDIVLTDIQAINGVIHVIDNVLLPAG